MRKPKSGGASASTSTTVSARRWRASASTARPSPPAPGRAVRRRHRRPDVRRHPRGAPDRRRAATVRTRGLRAGPGAADPRRRHRAGVRHRRHDRRRLGSLRHPRAHRHHQLPGRGRGTGQRRPPQPGPHLHDPPHPADHHLNIAIEDDGCGFDTTRSAGMGLRSIANRARAAGGDVWITSTAGVGTRIA